MSCYLRQARRWRCQNPSLGTLSVAAQDVPLPVTSESVPAVVDKSESRKSVTDSPKAIFTPVDPPDSPSLSSKVIVAVTRALTVKSWLAAAFPGSTASSAIATVIVPALPAVTRRVADVTELIVNAPRVPFVTVMSLATKLLMSMSESISMSTGSPALMSVSVVERVRVACDSNCAIKRHASRSV